MTKTITVLGGDTRQIYCARRLGERGFDVTAFGFELFEGLLKVKTANSLKEALNSDIIILPLPCTKNGKTLVSPFSESEYEFKDILNGAKPGSVFFMGKAPDNFISAAFASGHKAYDYFLREELTVKNALLTGEGVLSVILEKLPVTVFGLKVGITGYGRVAYFTAKILKALGSEVTVFARSSIQRTKAEAELLKAESLDCLSNVTHEFDCLVNTVPKEIIGEKELSALNKGCLLIETASAPFGINKEEAVKQGFNLINAQSLPGKTAPASAGQIIADTLEAMIKEVIP